MIPLPYAYRQTIFDLRCAYGHVRAKKGHCGEAAHPRRGVEGSRCGPEVGVRGGAFFACDSLPRNHFLTENRR